MTKRLVVMSVCLGAALFAVQLAVRAVFDLARIPLVANAWVLWMLMGAITAVAATIVVAWNGVGGSRRIVAAVAACVAAYAAWLATGAVVVALPWIAAIAAYGEVTAAALSLLFAVEAVALSWLISGVARSRATARVGDPA
jgi:hypothetical protein